VTDQSNTPGQPNKTAKDLLEGLSEKVAIFQPTLDDDEKALLSGIFSVAADTISASGDGRGKTNLVTPDDNEDSAIIGQGDDPPELATQLLAQFSSAFSANTKPPLPTSSFIIPSRPGDIATMQIIPRPVIIPKPADG
jgi:hypothetical protein